MTPFDYKKEYKALYLPKEMPSIVEVPSMQYAAVRGHGDPNEPDGEYGRAVAVLYGISYTIKMSYKGNRKVDGFFEYVVPPLEGFWWMEGGVGAGGLPGSTLFSVAVPHFPSLAVRKSDEGKQTV